MVRGSISYNSRSHLVFLQGKVNSARYIAYVNSVLLQFLRQEDSVFFSRTTQVHIWLLRCNVLFVVYNCSSQQELMKRKFTLSLEPATTIAELQWVQEMLGTIYRRMTFGTRPFACQNTCISCRQRGYNVY